MLWSDQHTWKKFRQGLHLHGIVQGRCATRQRRHRRADSHNIKGTGNPSMRTCLFQIGLTRWAVFQFIRLQSWELGLGSLLARRVDLRRRFALSATSSIIIRDTSTETLNQHASWGTYLPYAIEHSRDSLTDRLTRRALCTARPDAPRPSAVAAPMSMRSQNQRTDPWCPDEPQLPQQLPLKREWQNQRIHPLISAVRSVTLAAARPQKEYLDSLQGYESGRLRTRQ